MTIPSEHLRACPEHRVVSSRDEPCPCCETGIEARPDEFMANTEQPVEPLDLRWKIEPDTMIELIPLMVEYLADKDHDPPWVSVAEVDKRNVPAGYTVQERWFNVVRFESGAMRKAVMRESEARETIDNLRANGYTGTPPDPDGPNSDFDIPFEYTTGIKMRISGLQRGSGGHGMARNSVTHLYVEEAFTDGRLSREAGVLLCDPDYSGRFSVDEGKDDETREVTCKACLRLMDRWNVGEGDG